MRGSVRWWVCILLLTTAPSLAQGEADGAPEVVEPEPALPRAEGRIELSLSLFPQGHSGVRRTSPWDGIRAGLSFTVGAQLHRFFGVELFGGTVFGESKRWDRQRRIFRSTIVDGPEMGWSRPRGFVLFSGLLYFPGEIRVSQERGFGTQLFLSVGGGIAATRDNEDVVSDREDHAHAIREVHGAFTAGLGGRWFLAPWFALRWDLRVVAYRENLILDEPISVERVAPWGGVGVSLLPG